MIPERKFQTLTKHARAVYRELMFTPRKYTYFIGTLRTAVKGAKTIVKEAAHNAETIKTITNNARRYKIAKDTAKGVAIAVKVINIVLARSKNCDGGLCYCIITDEEDPWNSLQADIDAMVEEAEQTLQAAAEILQTADISQVQDKQFWLFRLWTSLFR